MENQEQIHEYISTKIYCLVAVNISLKDIKILCYHIAMLLFADKWTRPDLYLCVPFLCTRVKSQAIYDHTIIGRVVGYLNNIVHLTLITGTDSNGIMTWYIHASFAVYSDFNSLVGQHLQWFCPFSPLFGDV